MRDAKPGDVYVCRNYEHTVVLLSLQVYDVANPPVLRWTVLSLDRHEVITNYFHGPDESDQIHVSEETRWSLVASSRSRA